MPVRTAIARLPRELLASGQAFHCATTSSAEFKFKIITAIFYRFERKNVK
jgi:hypothetical protein